MNPELTTPRLRLGAIESADIAPRKRAEVALRLGISVNAFDNHLQAAFHSLRHLLIQDADVFTDVDHSLWYDHIEELRERYQARRLRRASGKTGESFTSRGERSNFEGEPSNSEGERSSSQGERSTSQGERDKTDGAGSIP